MLRNKVIITLGLFTLSLWATAQNTSLGRLFTMPGERLLLDQDRRGNDLQQGLTNYPDQTYFTDQATLEGYVIRNNGKLTTWVNQQVREQDHYKTQQGSSMRFIQNPHQPLIMLIKTQTGNWINIGVGDTVDMHTGTVRKLLQTKPETAAVANWPDEKTGIHPIQ